MNDEWSIQDVARVAGTTSRTLRHYDSIGLLAPTRVGHNGYRYYDRTALLRLQRILLLRELGLGLPQIADVLRRAVDESEALEVHLTWLRQEQDRLARQIASVATTIRALKGEEEVMAQEMFDGFDHTRYEEEVTERWGADAYAAGDRWWRAMTPDEKAAWQQSVADLSRDWVAAAERGVEVDSDEAQELARRHVEWLRGAPGTPMADSAREYVRGLGEMYVADSRFGANYATADGGSRGAEFVRDALGLYAETHL